MHKTRKALNEEVNKSFDDVIQWLDGQNDSHLNASLYEDKWTAAQHLFHLVKSSKATSNGFNLPKEKIKELFGQLDRDQYNADQLNAVYKQALAGGLKSPSQFVSDPNRMFTKAELKKRLQDEKENFKVSLLKWNDDELSSYVMPHPAIGNLTLYEFCLFNSMHNFHHLETLKTKYQEKALT